MPKLTNVATMTALAAAVLALTGCGKSATPAQKKTALAPSAAAGTAEAAAATTAAAKAAASAAESGHPGDEASDPDPTDAPGAATAAHAPAAVVVPPVDPRKNGWGLKSRTAGVKAGGRVFVLTRGRDRSHTDRRAVYHLYAHDVLAVKDDIVTLKELGGGDFKASGSFIIPAGVASAKALKKGDMVLAEWASSLKHAMVIGFQGALVKIRYTDLPDSWADDKITAVKSPRELTLQQDGMSPGNFAVASLDGQRYLVLLVAPADDQWVVRRFAGRVDTLPSKVLKPIPLRPALKRRQKVWVPWVGMMYSGTVQKTEGVHVRVAVDGIGQKKPILTPLGQVIPQ